jgi:hypothetical protein
MPTPAGGRRPGRSGKPVQLDRVTGVDGKSKVDESAARAAVTELTGDKGRLKQPSPSQQWTTSDQGR